MWIIITLLVGVRLGIVDSVGYLTDHRHEEFGIGAELQSPEPTSPTESLAGVDGSKGYLNNYRHREFGVGAELQYPESTFPYETSTVDTNFEGYPTNYRHREFGVGAELQQHSDTHPQTPYEDEHGYKVYDRRHYGHSAKGQAASSADSAAVSKEETEPAASASGSTGIWAAAATYPATGSNSKHVHRIVKNPPPRYIPRPKQRQAVKQTFPIHRPVNTPLPHIPKYPENTSTRLAQPTEPPAYRRLTQPPYHQKPTPRPVYPRRTHHHIQRTNAPKYTHRSTVAPRYRYPGQTRRRVYVPRRRQPAVHAQVTQRPVHRVATQVPVDTRAGVPAYVQPSQRHFNGRSTQSLLYTRRQYVQPTQRPVYRHPAHVTENTPPRVPLYIHPTQRPVRRQPTQVPLTTRQRTPLYAQRAQRPVYRQHTQAPVYTRSHAPGYVKHTQHPVYRQPTQAAVNSRPVFAQSTIQQGYAVPTQTSETDDTATACSSLALCFCCRWTTKYTQTTKTCHKPQPKTSAGRMCAAFRNGACVQFQTFPRFGNARSFPARCTTTSRERRCSSCCPARYGPGMPRCTTTTDMKQRNHFSIQPGRTRSQRNQQIQPKMPERVVAHTPDAASFYPVKAQTVHRNSVLQRSHFPSISNSQSRARDLVRSQTATNNCCSTTRLSECCATSYSYNQMESRQSYQPSTGSRQVQSYSRLSSSSETFDLHENAVDSSRYPQDDSDCCSTTEQPECCPSVRAYQSQSAGYRYRTVTIAPPTAQQPSHCCSSRTMRFECCSTNRVALGIPVSRARTSCCGSAQPLLSCCPSLQLADCCDSSRQSLCCAITNNAGKCCSAVSQWGK